MFIEVKDIFVRSLSVDFNEITWRIQDTAEDIYDYTFQVLRSEAAAGPFEPLSTEMEDQYIFVDNTLKNANIYRQFHYVVRVTNKVSGEQKDFGPAAQGAVPDLVAAELRKHMNLLLHEFAGRRCWVYPVRTMGQRCGSCWNATLRKKNKSGCLTCYDTSFVRGYHRPIETWIQFDPSPKNEQPSNLGKLQQVNTTARCSYFPPLKPEDLIIEAENNRWKVRTVATTQQGRAVVTQELQLHLVPKSDIEYRIPLVLQDVDDGKGNLRPITLNELYVNPSRNYTNPQTLDNNNEQRVDYTAIYNLYRG